MSADALRVIDGGGAPRGWEALWAKDEWHQRELPHGDLAIAYDREVVLRDVFRLDGFECAGADLQLEPSDGHALPLAH